jgi:ATP-dependent DNA helicase PIF1
LSNDLEAKEYQAIDSGESGYLHMLQKYCPAKERITLKVGAQVILVKTIDPSIGLVNGAKGVVIDFTKYKPRSLHFQFFLISFLCSNTKRPVVKFTNSQIQIIGTQTFSISLGKDIIAQRVQIPLDLSWAISVHKSQGMTLERAILDLKNSWEYGQVYGTISRVRFYFPSFLRSFPIVALSRVRDMDGLSLRHPLTNSQIKTHSRVKDFYQDLLATSLNSSLVIP